MIDDDNDEELTAQDRNAIHFVSVEGFQVAG
jgi:hypothetical protein